ncbi:MAG: hypothetical protein OXG11_13555 [Chloroflexi bacterium]|nr:hypothetical protein [Chloroflexota bacterium]
MNDSRQAEPVSVYVVPAPEGAVAFFDTDSVELDSGSSALRVDIYCPFDISEGEAEYIRAEVESELVAYAKRNAYRNARWPLFAALGIVDLVLLALLLIFVFINGDRSFLVFFWVFGVVFLAGPLAALRLISARRRCRWARSLLHTPVVAAFAGRSGEGSEAVNKVWSDLGRAGTRRDLATLEESCRLVRWGAGVRFYRGLRLGGDDAPDSRSLVRKLTGLFIADIEPRPRSYFPCRTS